MTIPAGYAHVVTSFTGPGTPTGAVITYGLQNVAQMTPQQICEEIATHYGSAVVTGSFSVQTSITGIHVKTGPDQTGPAADLGVDFPGGLGNSGSPAVAVLVSKNTLTGGRQGRGRFFLPAAAEADVDQSGQYSGANREQIEDIWNDILVKMATSELPLNLLHGNNLTPSPIMSFSVSSLVATQRRRVRR